MWGTSGVHFGTPTLNPSRSSFFKHLYADTTLEMSGSNLVHLYKKANIELENLRIGLRPTINFEYIKN